MDKKFKLHEGFAKLWHDRDEPFIRANFTYGFEDDKGYGSSISIDLVMLDVDVKVKDIREIALAKANAAFLELAKQIEAES